MEKFRSGPSKPVLGKGLASLLPAAATPPPAPPVNQENSQAMGSTTTTPNAAEPDSNRDRHPGISMAAIEEIAANEFQPRKAFDDQTIDELSQSIKENGLIQPLIVRKAHRGYQLIAGERRLRAAKLAGLKYVPIVIRRTTDRESLELALIENIQREDLNCMDTALAYYQLVQDFDLTQDELSTKMGKDRSSVANYMRLLKLPVKIQNDLKAQEISFGHGKALAGLEDNALAEKLAAECIEKKWSVRELENRIQMLKNLSAENSDASAETEPSDPVALRLKNLGRDLSAKYSTKVRLRGTGDRGKIVIEYFSSDDLNRVLDGLLK